MMRDLREEMRQERLAHWADGERGPITSDLRAALLSARTTMQATNGSGRPAPWIPGGVFLISPNLAPLLTALIDSVLEEDHG
jgi:hypothetical protein